MIEPHTKLFIKHTKSIDEELDYSMYQMIMKEMKNNGYIHYEFSNFCKESYESKHNLIYWQNNQVLLQITLHIVLHPVCRLHPT